jgi:plasmid stabilization system protein ParE
VKSGFHVRYTEPAESDLLRLFQHLIARAQTLEDFDAAELALAAIRAAVEGQLSTGPFLYRRAGADAFVRELVIRFGQTGYVALFEIEDDTTVSVLAVRHQREDDFH